MTYDTYFSNINFQDDIDEELFGIIAEDWAKSVSNEVIRRKDAQDKKNPHFGKNKYTQVRAFYDDIERLYRKSQKGQGDNFKTDVLPYVNMIKAKVNYAQSRDLVTPQFTDFTRHCIDGVKTEKDLERCKFFYESFMGFYRGLAPK